MVIRINVKEEHIINGKCRNPSECAVALAVNDIMTNICVSGNDIQDDYGEIITDLPLNAQMSIIEFDELKEDKLNISGVDRLKYVQPFSFTINVPDKKLNKLFPTSHIDEVAKLVKNSKNCELINYEKTI